MLRLTNSERKTSVAAANEIIELTKNRIALTPRRLMTLLYFCDIEYMTHNYAQSLFMDTYYIDDFGIVLANIDKHFPDGNTAVSVHLNNNGQNHSELTLAQKAVIRRVCRITQNMSDFQLQQLVQVKGGPWYTARSSDKNRIAIDRVGIYGYYKEHPWYR